MENIAKIFLLLGSPSFIGIFICIGFIWRPHFFFPLNQLLLLSCCVNIALKSTFQIPLAPHTGNDWFAFPSGHMQFATVIYGFLAYHMKKSVPLRIICLGRSVCLVPAYLVLIYLVLLGIGASLVISGFHTVVDVAGGAMVAGILLWTYMSQKDRPAFHKWMGILIIILPLYSLWMLWDTSHLWEKAGFWATASWMGVFFLNQQHRNRFALETPGKIIATSVFFCLVATLPLLSSKIPTLIWRHISIVGVCFLALSISAGAGFQTLKERR